MSPDPTTVRMDGPLCCFRQSFWIFLAERKYSPLSAMNQLRLLAHLDRWLVEQQQEVRTLAFSDYGRFLDHRRQAGYTCWTSRRALVPILEHLIEQGAITQEAIEPTRQERFADVLESFRRWLIEERCLSAAAWTSRVKIARLLLEHAFGDDVTASIDSLNTAHLFGFLHARHERYSARTIAAQQSELRVFARFLFLHGLHPTDLRGALQASPNRRLAALPSTLDESQIKAVLGSCDRRRRRGRRDYAILLLMLRLGLRRGDVAQLTLDDFDWPSGEIRVSGKSRREDRLPLPDEIGRAIVAYLKHSRPKEDTRALFLTLQAPVRPIVAGTITSVIQHACRVAGLPPGSAPRLRHTAATRLLAAGASLDEIAQLLRHRSIDTTAIYAKIDDRALIELVRSWPEPRT